MSGPRYFSACSLCVALAASAQTLPPAPPPAPSPHSHAHAHANSHGSVTLDQFVISAAPFARNQVDLAQSTTVLGGQALLMKQQPSLGETLAAEAGMSATSFGPGASRPIIRGLGGDRIRLLENSVGTLDASVVSPDHAVSIEPFLVERIEVVRGPASLLYGSNAVGGVVNVITHRIETDLPTEAVRGTVEVRGSSAADEFARGGVLDISLRPSAERAVVFHFDGFRRSTNDVRIPGFAESAEFRTAEIEHAREHGEPTPPFARGRLPNSALDSQSGALGLSFITKSVHLGASYSGLDSNYGVPGHAHDVAPGDAAGTRVELRQRRTDVQGEWHGGAGWLTGARAKFGRANYRHAEVEPDGTVGTTFRNDGYDARVEMLHGDGKPWTGAVGAQSSRSRFSAAGDEAFLPSSDTRSTAVFAFEEYAVGPVAWQFGGRLERSAISPAGGTRRRFTEPSGSLGAVWKVDATHVLALSLTHTGRAPNAQELFAHGPHAGTQTFEIGNAGLKPEHSNSLEASLRRRTGLVSGGLTLFANDFRGYIFEQPTGQLAVAEGGDWAFVAPGHPAADGSDETLPVYRTIQRNARFWGVELETLWHLHERAGGGLDLRVAADLTRAREGGRSLPRIPAARISAGLAWTQGEWTAGLEAQAFLAQRRVAPNEAPSDAYTLLSMHFARTFEFGHRSAQVFLRGTNLTNDEARPHPSLVKHLAPLPGRSLSAGIRLSF